MKKALMIYDFRRGIMNEFYLNKDQVLLSKYIAEKYDIETTICFIADGFNKKLKEMNYIGNMKFIKILKINPKLSDIFIFIKNIRAYLFVLKNIKNFDYLYLYHLTIFNYIYIFFSKLVNKKIKIYLKGDMSDFYLQKITNFKKGNIFNKIRYIFILKILKQVSLFSLESIKLCKETQKEFKKFEKKIIYLPNGFDSITNKNLRIKNFKEKENIILSIGRLDDENKNFSLMLEALKEIDLKNWKFYIIGPYSGKIKKEIEDFFKKYPEKNKKIFFLGEIKNKERLYSYYNKAKIFTLSSKLEGFPLVLVEALYFGNYLYVTNFSSSVDDITKNGEVGIKVDIDLKAYKRGIEKLIVNNEFLEKKYDKIIEYSRKSFIWEKIVENQKIKEFFK